MMFLLTNCSSSEEKYTPITSDFSSEVEVVKPLKLSEQLGSLSDSMSMKTGVYTLEEGDASMIIRAWLCESAEKTIDIQYFIFSADNI
jgi:hypothetical protein